MKAPPSRVPCSGPGPHAAKRGTALSLLQVYRTRFEDGLAEHLGDGAPNEAYKGPRSSTERVLVVGRAETQPMKIAAQNAPIRTGCPMLPLRFQVVLSARWRGISPGDTKLFACMFVCANLT